MDPGIGGHDSITQGCGEQRKKADREFDQSIEQHRIEWLSLTKESAASERA
jgi:hypothetical protein